jgi:hypothetical protein
MIKHYEAQAADPQQMAYTAIQIQKDFLEQYRGETPNPDELEWELRLCDYMLRDPAKRWEEYTSVRFDKDGIPWKEKR